MCKGKLRTFLCHLLFRTKTQHSNLDCLGRISNSRLVSLAVVGRKLHTATGRKTQEKRGEREEGKRVITFHGALSVQLFIGAVADVRENINRQRRTLSS